LDQIVLLEPDVHFVRSVGIEQATPKTKAKFDDTRDTNENQKYDCEYFGTTLHNSFGDPGYIFDIFYVLWKLPSRENTVQFSRKQHTTAIAVFVGSGAT
jgi:hypothetical protein